MPSLILVGMLVYVVLIHTAPGETFNPHASIEFQLDEYEHRLKFDDFRPFYLFADLECGACEFTGLGPQYFASDRAVGYAFRVQDSSQLVVSFYGRDASRVKAVVSDFVRHLRSSQRFERGFNVYDLDAGTAISREEEANWLSNSPVPIPQ